MSPTNQESAVSNSQDSGRYFRYMAQFVGFNQDDAGAIRESGLIVEKHLPNIISRFYTNLLQYPPTRKHFLARDGSVDEEYLQLRMFHQANFWRRTAGGVYDDDYANYVDYVGRAHTSRGADKRIYIAERYVIGMVGYVQHAIINALMEELGEFDPELEGRAIKAWNKLCMVILEMLARAYGHEREAEKYEELQPVDADDMYTLSVDSYEKSLGLERVIEHKDLIVATADEIPDGERKIVEVEGVSIGIFHHNGEWYALSNSCLHRGGPVCTGKLKGDVITCPWHGYTYNITNGGLLIDPGTRLKMYPVKVIENMVHIIFPITDETTNEHRQRQLESLLPDVEQDAIVSLRENEFYLEELPPGKIKVVKVDDVDVAVYNINGEFYATDEECTHAGGPLSEGQLQGNLIVCPWHDSCFDVRTGEVVCEPATIPLETYEVILEGDIGKVLKPA